MVLLSQLFFFSGFNRTTYQINEHINSDLSLIKDIFHKLWQIITERTFQAGLYLTLYLEKLL